ncbi:unnamed protein product [Calypogeia fissa]
MFEVVRYLGPDGPSGSKPKKSGGRLTLQQLNARARERAVSRRIQAAAAVGEAAPRISSGEAPLSNTGANGDVHISSVAVESVDNEALEDVKGVSKKEKKRKKREEKDGASDGAVDVASAGAETVVDEAVEDGIRRLKKEKKEKTKTKIVKREENDDISEKVEEEVTDKNDPPVPDLEPKVKESKKRKARAEARQDSPNESVQSEVLASESRLSEGGVRNLGNGESSALEKRKKKKKRNPERESESQMRIDRTETNEDPPAMSEVSPSLLQAVHANGNASDTEHQNLSEKGDLDAADDTAPVKRKKKKKIRAGAEVVEGKDADANDFVDLPMPDSTIEEPAEKLDEIPGEEFDLSRIEKDVEMIMGKTPAKAAEVQGKGPPVLPWMRDPLEIGALKVQPLNHVPGLDVRLQEALRNTGIVALFPVQVAVWNETVGPGNCERDLCVCSPTGSGKTLSYALPIVQKLSTRVIRRLRALVVLPTRDLATQVKTVLDTIAPAVGLKVGLAVGQTSIIAEAAELVRFQKKMVHSFGTDEASIDDVADSSVDILVATPGRLMDHLRNTKGFTLQHLYYLVVDETDRLLRQSYQDWLSNVLNTVAATESKDIVSSLASSVSSGNSFRSVRTIRHLGRERGMRSTVHPRLMKIVLSATLTRDPAKIAQLALHYPMYIAQSAVENRYQLPEQLQAFKLVCKPGEKPLYLVALLQQLVGQQTIVFTASVVATHRLFTLLSYFEGLPFKVVEYSSLQHQQARSKSLAKFREGEVQVLVASDAMTRGMDVEGVGNVVNYDMPVYAKTYVHRVGRTARAGKAGCSYTILRREEVRHFKSLLKKANNSSCKDYTLPASANEELYERYLKALEKLKEITLEEAGSAPATSKGGKEQVLADNNGSGPDELFL